MRVRDDWCLLFVLGRWDDGDVDDIYCLLELNMLCVCVTRGYGDHSRLTTAAIVERQKRSAGGRAAVVRPV